MNDSELRRGLLQALATLSQSGDNFDLFDLARASDQSLYVVLRGLEDLGSLGLVEQRRLRLTLAGLAVASALGFQKGGFQKGGFQKGGCHKGGALWPAPAQRRPKPVLRTSRAA
jgi:hypothetical protein